MGNSISTGKSILLNINSFKLTYSFNAIPIINSADCVGGGRYQANSKTYIETQRTWTTKSILKNKDKVEELMLPDFETYYKAVKKARSRHVGWRIDRCSRVQSRRDPQHTAVWFLAKAPKPSNEERKAFSISIA